jgi:hypothetical protein
MLEHLFPLQVPPTCRECGLPCTHDIVNDRNLRGHVGRPYWTCVNHEPWKFSCWDDTVGITIGNPKCLCSITSRRTAGKNGDFFSCATGVCGWTQSAASRRVWSSPVTPPATPSRSRVAANRNLAGGHMRMDFVYQTPYGTHELLVEPSRPTAAVAVNANRLGRDDGRDYATNWNILEAKSIRAISTNELPGRDGGQADGYQSSYGMSVQPAALSSPMWAGNANLHGRHVGMGYGYPEHGRRGGCCALLRWLCGCCGVLNL